MNLVLAVLLQAVSAGPTEPATLLAQLTNASHWELVSAEGKGPHPGYGAGGIDVLIFTDDGGMCAISTKPAKATPDGGVTAYCGEFKVDEAKRSVVFDVETDALPNDLSSGVRRHASVAGDILTLRVMREGSDVEEYTLTLKRSPKAE